MKNEKEKPNAVVMQRKIRAQITKATEDMDFEAFRQYIRERASKVRQELDAVSHPAEHGA